MEQALSIADLLHKKDTSAFCLLYDKYAASLYGFILKLIPDKAMASQLLEQSFVTICSRLSLYNPAKETIFSWMLRITLKQCSAVENFDRARLVSYMASEQATINKHEPLPAL